MRQRQFAQKLFKIESCFKAQLYWHSLFAEMLVAMMVGVLDLYTLHEASPIYSKTFKFFMLLRAQLYCHSLFTEMLVTVTVALLDPYTLREPTPLESNSICVMSLKAAKARNGNGIFSNLCKFKYCSKAQLHWESLFCGNACDNDGGFTHLGNLA